MKNGTSIHEFSDIENGVGDDVIEGFIFFADSRHLKHENLRLLERIQSIVIKAYDLCTAMINKNVAKFVDDIKQTSLKERLFCSIEVNSSCLTVGTSSPGASLIIL